MPKMFIAGFFLFSISHSLFSQVNAFRAYIIDIPPYGVLEKKQVKGIYSEIFDFLESQTQIHFKKAFVPYARAANTVASQPKSLTIMFDSAALQAKTKKIAPLFEIQTYILLSKNQKHIKKLSEIEGLKIGRIRGGCFDLKDKVKNIKFFDLTNFELGLNLLSKSRIDGVCSTMSVFNYVKKKSGFTSADFGGYLLSNTRTVYLHSSLDITSDEEKLFSSAVISLKENEKYKKLIDKILSDPD